MERMFANFSVPWQGWVVLGFLVMYGIIQLYEIWGSRHYRTRFIRKSRNRRG